MPLCYRNAPPKSLAHFSNRFKLISIKNILDTSIYVFLTLIYLVSYLKVCNFVGDVEERGNLEYNSTNEITVLPQKNCEVLQRKNDVTIDHKYKNVYIANTTKSLQW